MPVLGILLRTISLLRLCFPPSGNDSVSWNLPAHSSRPPPCSLPSGTLINGKQKTAQPGVFVFRRPCRFYQSSLGAMKPISDGPPGSAVSGAADVSSKPGPTWLSPPGPSLPPGPAFPLGLLFSVEGSITSPGPAFWAAGSDEPWAAVGLASRLLGSYGRRLALSCCAAL